MDEAVGNLEKQMQKADKKLDNLTIQVVHVEREMLRDVGTEVEVNNLLRSVTDVKNDYQNLRKEILEVQDLQKQLSNSLQTQLQLLQSKHNLLKKKLMVNVPKSPGCMPKIIITDASPGKALQNGK